MYGYEFLEKTHGFDKLGMSNTRGYLDNTHVPKISLLSDFSQFLLPAIQNVHLALLDLGIRKIAVSTTFSFINVVTTFSNFQSHGLRDREAHHTNLSWLSHRPRA